MGAFGIPKHVKMFDNYYEAIKEYGKFYNKLPSNYELRRIEVYTLYELQIDENENVINAIEIGYNIL